MFYVKEKKLNTERKKLLILPRQADTARYARCVGWAGEVQHQVMAGQCTGHSSSLLSAAVIHFSLWTVPILFTIWLCNNEAHTRKHTCNKINSLVTLNIHCNSQSWETSYSCRHETLDFSGRDIAWNSTLLLKWTRAGTEGRGECREVTFFLWLTLHLPISTQAGGGDRKGERKRGEWLWKRIMLSNVSFSALHLIWQSLKLFTPF